MKVKIAILTLSLLFVSVSPTLAHSGRTDSSGCHNCNVGSCAGTYHCHNDGYVAPAPVYNAPEPTPTIKPTLKPTIKPTTPTPSPSYSPSPVVESATTTNTSPTPESVPTQADSTAGGLVGGGRHLGIGILRAKMVSESNCSKKIY